MPHDDSSLPVVEDLEANLETTAFGRVVRSYRSLRSTNTEASTWARDGAPEGSLVLTEHQTAGRGRRGRSWQARPGKNLLFSLVLRPTLPPERLGLITLAAGLAAADAITAFVSPLAPRIKWPNDVLIEGRKCCGILLESIFERTGAPSVVVLGIGLNANQTRFPEELSEQATSLRLETGRFISRGALLARLLLDLEKRYKSVQRNGGEALIAEYEGCLSGMGKPVTLHHLDTHAAFQGILAGITPSGALRLKAGDDVRTFYAGEVSFSSP